MRKTAMMFLLFAVALSFASFRDIPPGHWAKPFVDRLVGFGIVTGFPDGTYRGDESVTRYQIALLLSRTIDYLQSSLEPTVKAVESLSAELVNLRRFLNDLNVLVGRKADASDLKKVANDVERLQTNLESLRVGLGGLNDKLAELADKIREEIDVLATQLQDVELTLELHESDILKLYELFNGLQDALEVALAELKSSVDTYTVEVKEEFETSLSSLQSMVADAIMGQAEELKNVSDRVENIAERVEILENEVFNLLSLLDKEIGAVKDLLYELADQLTLSEEAAKVYADALFTGAQSAVDTLAEELREHIEDLRIALSELEELLHDRIGMLSEAFLSQQEQIADIFGKLEALETEILNLGFSLRDELSVIGNALYEEIKNVEEALKGYTESLTKQLGSDVQEKVDNLTGELESLKMFLQLIEQRLMLAEEKIVAVQLDTVDLENKLKDLASEIIALKEGLQGLATEVQDTKVMVEEAFNILGALEGAMNDRYGELAEAFLSQQEQIAAIVEKLEALENEVLNLSSSLRDELSVVGNALYDEIRNVEEATKEQYLNLLEKLDLIEMALENLEIGLGKAIEELVGYTDLSVEQLRGEIIEQLDGLTAYVQDLEIKIEELQTSLETLDQKIEDRFGMMSELFLTQQEQIADIVGRLEALELDVLNIGTTLREALPAIRSMIYGVSEEVKATEALLKAYVDLLIEQLGADVQEKTDLLSNELDGLKMFVELLEQRMGILEDKIATVQFDIIGLENKMNEMVEQLVSYIEASAQDLSAQIDQVFTSLRELESETMVRYDLLADILLSHQDQISALVNAHEELLASLNELENSVASKFEMQQGQIAELAQRLDQAEVDILNIQSTLRDGLPMIRALIFSVSEEVKTVEQAVKAYTDILIEQLTEDVGAKMEEIKGELDSVKMYLDIVENRLRILEEKVVELQLVQQENYNDIIDKLHAVVTNLEQTKEEFSANLTELRDYISVLEEVVNVNLEMLASILGEHGVKIDELSLTLAELEERLFVFENIMNSNIESLSFSIGELNDLLNATVERVDAHDEELAMIKEKILELEATIESKYETVADAILGQQEAIVELSNKLDKLSESVVNLEKETKKDLAGTNTLAVWALVIGLVGLAIGVYAAFIRQ